MSTLETLYAAVIEGDAKGTTAGIAQSLDAGIEPSVILNQSLIPAMAEVGKRFEQGEYYVPEMLVAARAMKAGLELLKPRLIAAAVEPVGKIALGTVKGDLHDIGKNLVAMMMEGAGFQIIDLGVDVPPEKFAAAIEDGVQIIGMSAMLTTTMPWMNKTIEHLVKTGLRERVRVMVGGAPVNDAFAHAIGADAYANDASTAARRALELIRL
ncbi:dimethylamine corrinoid protein [Anaerolineales bacterium]|nr:dimethylamine corrinoid protein [Anaerolineales bacterium]